jgi:putative ABC transport system ATP-binding protein
MQSQTLINCQNITKTFGQGDSQVLALRGIDLEVFAGELLLLVGPSGCGKTTFISIISALLPADVTKTSICEVLGNNLLRMDDKQKADFRSHCIGFVFQSFNLLPALSALENIAVPLLIQGVKRSEALAKAQIVLDNVGLSVRAQALSGELSGGQQQRVAIARALVHEPQLLLCDEPTSSLDHQSGQLIMQLLKDISRQHNTTVIVVTHDNRIYDFADRMAFMDDGKITKIEVKKEL